MKYAIITDIHEDIISLGLALKKIEKLKCDEIICLGDISGFTVYHIDYFKTRNASECLRLVRKNCKVIIAGNHDLHAARKTPEISPDYKYPEEWYKLNYHERLIKSDGKVWLYDNDELSPLYRDTDIEFLKTLPEYHILKTNNYNVLLSHFIYPNITGSAREFYHNIEDFEQHINYMSEAKCHFSFAGHRHFAGLFIASDKGILEKRYNRKYTPEQNDCILIPPVTGNRIGNGFCIFDTENNSIEAIRI
jgi:predicted phosphodiesterase